MGDKLSKWWGGSQENLQQQENDAVEYQVESTDCRPVKIFQQKQVVGGDTRDQLEEPNSPIETEDTHQPQLRYLHMFVVFIVMHNIDSLFLS